MGVIYYGVISTFLLHERYAMMSTGPRAYHGCATVDMLIYLIGGFDGMDYFNSVRCFNPVTKEWFEVAPMNSRRYIQNVVQRLSYRRETARRSASRLTRCKLKLNITVMNSRWSTCRGEGAGNWLSSVAAGSRGQGVN